ncbi:chloride channel CLIC-like protein 1 [Patiria miniata]|uniref:Chloride channel CLIC-like protein 1 n=1 Tax=Patiria miniata TaxID=46514 RepID=A0A914AZC2_PATMI|nr:chloride channel CLIC-like protein 1 [Patiria miniata]
MAFVEQMLLGLLIILVGMATASVSIGDPLQDNDDFLWEETPSRDVVDHTDMLNFDPSTRTMRNKSPKNEKKYSALIEECRTDLIQCRQNLADFHEKTLIDAMYDKNEAHDKVGSCKKELTTCQEDLADCKLGYNINMPAPADESLESPCKLEQMFFRRFAKRFINLLIAESTDDKDSPLEAEIRVELGTYSWSKLRQFVQQKGKVKLVDAHDLMDDMLVSARHDNMTDKPGWLERMTGMDPTNIKFYVLLFLLSVIVIVFESKTQATWWQQLSAVFVVLFLISVGWNWIYLYKKELAHKISNMQKDREMPAHCTPDKMTWWDSIKEVFRKQLTFQEDACDVYHENILVDPIYEVPPTRAISHTVSVMFMEPLKPLGKHIADFNRELFRDLPYFAWIPAFLTVPVIVVTICIAMYYCPCLGRRRKDVAAQERVRQLEDQLRERDAIDRRRERLQELEYPRKVGYQVAQPAPMPALNPYMDGGHLQDIPQAQHQRHQYPNQPLAAEEPPARVRRRPRGSSESDVLQQRQPRQALNLGAHGALSAPYHGDVSGGDDSSDDADDLRGQRPRGLHLDGVQGRRVSPSRVGVSRAASDERLRSKRTEIQGLPVECPNSELDSMEERSNSRKAAKTQGPSEASQKASEYRTAAKGGSCQGEGLSADKGMVGGMEPEEEAKVRKEKPKSGEVADTVSASITPSSSTDSEPFVTSAPGLDSPSSVSVIEGDSSPASGGSVDGDTHLQGLGMSLSGSIDIIEPLGPLGGGGEGDRSEDGQESDEFEVLSREQCQAEDME